jgi:hypothetical protein
MRLEKYSVKHEIFITIVWSGSEKGAPLDKNINMAKNY